MEFLESLCRLCSLATPNSSLVSLYDTDNEENEITTKIKHLIGSDMVAPNDGLPQEVCLFCAKKVDNCYDFVISAIKNYEKLKYLTDPANNPIEGDNMLKLIEMVNNEVNDTVDVIDHESEKSKESPAVKENLSSSEKCSETGASTMTDVNERDKVNFEEIAVGDILTFNGNRASDVISSLDDNDDLEIVYAEEDVASDDYMMEDYRRKRKCIMETEEEQGENNVKNKEVPMKILAFADEDAVNDYSVVLLKNEAEDEYARRRGLTKKTEEFAVKKEQVPSVKILTFPEEAMGEYSLALDIKNEPDYERDENAIATKTKTAALEVEAPEIRHAGAKVERTRSTKILSFSGDGRCSSMLNFNDDDRTDEKIQQTISKYVNSVDYRVVLSCGSCNEMFFSHSEASEHRCDNKLATISVEYSCTHCNKLFKSRLALSLHLDQHEEQTVLYCCVYCNQIFEDEVGLNGHLRTVHKLNVTDHPTTTGKTSNNLVMAQCDICGKITSQLEQHKMFHVVQNLEFYKSNRREQRRTWFYCDLCGRKVPTEIAFWFHLAEHNGENGVRCKECDFFATSVSEYIVHSSQHTGEKSYVCNDCDKCFQTRSAITDHVLLHMDGMRYMCEICGKQFKTCRAHAQHKLLQHRRYLRCGKCNRGFSTEMKLKSHLDLCLSLNKADKGVSNDSDNGKSRFYCEICKTYMKSSSYITRLFHQARHEGKPGVPCKYCHALCKNIYTYKNHLLIHSEERPFSCSQCPKSFRTKGCLVQHMLVHGDEYKYVCSFCGKKSKKLTTHINHVNIHTDTRPYTCPDCSRPFRQLSDMKKHRKTHNKRSSLEQALTRFSFIQLDSDIKEEMMNADNIIF